MNTSTSSNNDAETSAMPVLAVETAGTSPKAHLDDWSFTPRRPARQTNRTLSVPIDIISFADAQEVIVSWAKLGASRYVVLANAHVVVTARRQATFGAAVSGADMATPDGAPVAWMLRALGHHGQERVSGPDLMWALFEKCQSARISVYFYGSTNSTMTALLHRVTTHFPNLEIAGAESPPFGNGKTEPDMATISRINSSDAGLVFVGLGCPKQEIWMKAHYGRINAVMLGVGAAFDFHAGTIQRAPKWMRKIGLEWLYRLAREPRRLWRRYLVTNTLFIVGAATQLLFAIFKR